MADKDNLLVLGLLLAWTIASFTILIGALLLSLELIVGGLMIGMAGVLFVVTREEATKAETI